MVDEKTTNLSLPLPYPENSLEADVDRLREALAMLDAAIPAAAKAAVWAQIEGKPTAFPPASHDHDSIAGVAARAETVPWSGVSDKEAAAAETLGCVKIGIGMSVDADHKLAVVYGDKPETAAQGNDPRLNATYITAAIGTDWSGTGVPLLQSIEIPGVTATSIVEITIPPTATQEEVEQYQGLNFTGGSQADGSIQLRAWGDKNAAPVPILVLVRG